MCLNIYMLFAGLEVRIKKKCARGLEHGPRPQASGRTQDRERSFSQYGPPYRQITNIYFTSEIRDCLDLFGTPMALKRAPAKYAIWRRLTPNGNTKN